MAVVFYFVDSKQKSIQNVDLHFKIPKKFTSCPSTLTAVRNAATPKTFYKKWATLRSRFVLLAMQKHSANKLRQQVLHSKAQVGMSLIFAAVIRVANHPAVLGVKPVWAYLRQTMTQANLQILQKPAQAQPHHVRPAAVATNSLI